MNPGPREVPADSAPRIMIVAGEASGDVHAAHVVQALRERVPSAHFYGIAGKHMQREGVEAVVDARHMAVVGLVEVLRHYRFLHGVLQRLRGLLRTQRPDLLILVDYPDFNLRLAHTAHGLGIPVLYYISPQVWAWRKGRVKTIAQRVDRMAVVFPFEVPLYQGAGLNVEFVGHPLAETLPSIDRNAARGALGLSASERVVGLFPGSRRSEIKRLLPVLVASAARLRTQFPQVRFMLPLASSLDAADLAPYLANADVEIEVMEDRTQEVMHACDAIVTASGTVTLEIALAGTPMLIIYRVAPLSYALLRHIIKLPYIGLCNIVAQREVAPELLQNAANPERIAPVVTRMLEDEAYANALRAGLAGVRALLGEAGCASNVARMAHEMLATRGQA